MLAVAISLPVPLLFPLLVDQVLLEKPAQLTGLVITSYSIHYTELYDSTGMRLRFHAQACGRI